MLDVFDIFGHHVHRIDRPWSEAPAWAIELRIITGAILKREGTIMSLQDDLSRAVSNLASGYQALSDDVHKELAAVASVISGASDQAAKDAAITTAIANISAITNKMATDASAVTAAIPATPTIVNGANASPVTAPATVTPPSIAAPPSTDTAAGGAAGGSAQSGGGATSTTLPPGAGGTSFTG